MPVTPSYPGVYIEEIPSGVRTISGVATSIAVFVGWAPKGPTDRAQRVLSFPDYERNYGGLDPRSLLGYSVNHFFGNGGQTAYILRIADVSAVPATVDLEDAGNTDVLTLTAKSPGAWANDYGFTVSDFPDDLTRFNLSIVIDPGAPTQATVESFPNLSMDENDRRYVEAVVNRQSLIVDATVIPGMTPPPDRPANLTAQVFTSPGDDGTVIGPGNGTFQTDVTAAAADGGILDQIDLFNILCVPGEIETNTIQALQAFCRDRRAFLIVDCEETATTTSVQAELTGKTGANSVNSALYFPWLRAPDPMQEGNVRAFPPCGFMAGIYARTDVARGVWKAPAGTEASLTGVSGVAVPLTDSQNGILNPLAINCIRTFPVYGTVSWGARTLHGNEERGSEWKYIPIRRLALFLEESLYRGTQWVVFEPNDEPLWSQIRLNVGAFMQNLFRQGAFQGTTPQQAYFVKCDSETTTQNDIDRGIVNIVVGFAPLKPAEFVIIQIQQIAGQLQT